jgi:CheY-like chemotaxis protein
MIRKILLIEDNPDDIALTKQAIEKSGFEHELVVITDGKEALDYILRQGKYSDLQNKDRPDLIILDLNIPMIHGFDLLEKLKSDEQARVIPTIILTISNSDTDVIRSYELGACSCIRKRISIPEFEEAIRDIMTYWFNYTKLPPRN